jgi:MYXO-CTERM domain-containing protein
VIAPTGPEAGSHVPGMSGSDEETTLPPESHLRSSGCSSGGSTSGSFAGAALVALVLARVRRRRAR